MSYYENGRLPLAVLVQRMVLLPLCWAVIIGLNCHTAWVVSALVRHQHPHQVANRSLRRIQVGRPLPPSWRRPHSLTAGGAAADGLCLVLMPGRAGWLARWVCPPPQVRLLLVTLVFVVVWVLHGIPVYLNVRNFMVEATLKACTTPARPR